MRNLRAVLLSVAMVFVAGSSLDLAKAEDPPGKNPTVEHGKGGAGCREKRRGWHGWGWYPCKEDPAAACHKCRWRWGYKYCWKIC